MSKPWLQGPLALSKESCRFELPMDMHDLEKIDVLKYLSDFCVVCSRRQHLYRQFFVRADKDRDGQLTLTELKETMTNVIYIQSNASACLEEILTMITRGPLTKQDRKELKIDFQAFKGIGAFLERMICWKMERQNSHEESKQAKHDQRNTLEKTDFDGLKWKLRGVQVDSHLLTLFRYL